ncbi:MAG: hypothetical protein CMJ90_06035 [Planctomycetes bacterium]|nr:hypothetical protein [Planctomycetota bacterium]
MAGMSVLALLLALLCGCTSRTLTVESEPTGARVILNRREIGDTPVTVPFRYGGINEILIIPRPGGPGAQPYKPALVYHDTWRFALDAPFVDALAEIGGTQDHQAVHVTLEKNDFSALVEDERTQQDMLAGLRARADVLRSRAREKFIAAPPRDAPRKSGGAKK